MRAFDLFSDFFGFGGFVVVCGVWLLVVVGPVLKYVGDMRRRDFWLMVAVILPQAVPSHGWQGLLHRDAAVSLKMALGTRKNVMVTKVRNFLDGGAVSAPGAEVSQ